MTGRMDSADKERAALATAITACEAKLSAKIDTLRQHHFDHIQSLSLHRNGDYDKLMTERFDTICEGQDEIKKTVQKLAELMEKKNGHN